MHKVAIIIPFYNGASYLQRLISSVFCNAGELDATIYIVDNSIASQRLPVDYTTDNRVVVLSAPTGIGYGRACNIGFERCKKDCPDFIAVVNQDGYFEADALQVLVNRLLNEKNFTVAMPRLTRYESLAVEPFMIHVYLAPMVQLISDLFNGATQAFYPADALCGACFMINAKNFPFEVLFDPTFHMYYEDADLGRRLRLSNHRMMFVPQAVFHHSHTNSNDAMHTLTHLCGKQTSRHIYQLKNPEKQLWKAVASWSVIEFQSMVDQVLKLKARDLFVELVSCFRLLTKLGAVAKSRKTEKMVRLQINHASKECNNIWT